MKVFSRVEPIWIVTKRGYRDGSPPKYRAFPPGSNRIEKEQSFETEEELAIFLKSNPDWKSYFRHPTGHPRNQHLTEVR